MNDEKIWLETEDGQKLFIIKTEKCDMQKELTETIDYLQQELQRKDNIINKAIEYIKIHKNEVNKSQVDLFNEDRKDKSKLKIGTFMWGIDELENILRGDNK